MLLPGNWARLSFHCCSLIHKCFCFFPGVAIVAAVVPVCVGSIAGRLDDHRAP